MIHQLSDGNKSKSGALNFEGRNFPKTVNYSEGTLQVQMLDVRRISLPKLAEKTETTWIGEMDLWDFGRYIGPRKAISSHSSFHPPKWESFPSLIHFFFIRGIVRRRGFNIEFEKDQTVKKNKSCHVCFCYFLRNAQHYDFLKKSLVKFDLFFARPCPEWPLPRTRSSLPTKLIRCEVINRLVSALCHQTIKTQVGPIVDIEEA